MPKYYCDYCDTYLTHDSVSFIKLQTIYFFLQNIEVLLLCYFSKIKPSVRKTHCTGRKHKENVRDYYQKWMEEQAQRLIDQTSESILFFFLLLFIVGSKMYLFSTLAAAFKSGKIAPGAYPPRFGMPPPMSNIYASHFFFVASHFQSHRNIFSSRL